MRFDEEKGKSAPNEKTITAKNFCVLKQICNF